MDLGSPGLSILRTLEEEESGVEGESSSSSPTYSSLMGFNNVGRVLLASSGAKAFLESQGVGDSDTTGVLRDTPLPMTTAWGRVKGFKGVVSGRLIFPEPAPSWL